ncbi:hypothetical protein ABTN36_18700, partial [Acinetobacter baumannii]
CRLSDLGAAAALSAPAAHRAARPGHVATSGVVLCIHPGLAGDARRDASRRSGAAHARGALAVAGDRAAGEHQLAVVCVGGRQQP